MQTKKRIQVSGEMLSFVGAGTVPSNDWPTDPVGLSFDDTVMVVHAHPTSEAMISSELAFVVTASACRRIFGFVPEDDARWHLPSELRALVIAILCCELPGEACDTLRLAKSIELLCAAFAMMSNGSLVPVAAVGDLTEIDARCIVAARRLIDERWQEKLTLDSIARACGINRAKLTRGFREMFGMTVADAIADRRLGGAGNLLRATDLPIASIGYKCGYLSNASFARAFSRRYGVPPSLYRAHRAVA